MGAAILGGMTLFRALTGSLGSVQLGLRAAMAAAFLLGALATRWLEVQGLRRLLLASGVVLSVGVSALTALQPWGFVVSLPFLLLVPIAACVLYPQEPALSVATGVLCGVGGGVAVYRFGLGTPALTLWMGEALVTTAFIVYGTLRYRRLRGVLEEEVEVATGRLTTALAEGALLRHRTEEEVHAAAVEVLRGHGLVAGVLLVEEEQLRLGAHHLPEAAVSLLRRMAGVDVVQVRLPLARLPHVVEAFEQRRPFVAGALSDVLRELYPGRLARGLTRLVPAAGRSALLFVEGRPYGLLSVRGEGLTGARAAAIELFARHLEAAVENVRAHQRLKERLEQVKRLQGERVAQERLAVLGEAAAVVADQLRAPLATLERSRAELSAEALSPDGAHLLSMVGEEAARLDELVRELLFLARPLEPTLEPVDLAELVERCLWGVRVQAAAAGVELLLRPAQVPSVRGDRAHLQVAVENLLRNAVQASPPGGKVVLELASAGGAALLSVEDAGPGVSEADRERIFEPFYTTRVSGTGLGLSIVRRVVQAHGASLQVGASRLGGARFELKLGAA